MTGALPPIKVSSEWPIFWIQVVLMRILGQRLAGRRGSAAVAGLAAFLAIGPSASAEDPRGAEIADHGSAAARSVVDKRIKPRDIAIYPGFEREELPMSVESTIAAAQACISNSREPRDVESRTTNLRVK